MLIVYKLMSLKLYLIIQMILPILLYNQYYAEKEKSIPFISVYH